MVVFPQAIPCYHSTKHLPLQKQKLIVIVFPIKGSIEYTVDKSPLVLWIIDATTFASMHHHGCTSMVLKV